MSIKYVNTRGWLLVKISNIDGDVLLPPYLRVDFFREQDGKEFFKVLEGKYIGNEGYVNQGDSNRFFGDGNPFRSEGIVHFVKNINKLWYYDEQWIGPLEASTDQSNPLPIGTFNLDIPDELHGVFNPNHYYSTTWFPISNETNKYLHPDVGISSAGCFLRDVSKWENIFYYLIISRKNDYKGVGTIKVYETEENREF